MFYFQFLRKKLLTLLGKDFFKKVNYGKIMTGLLPFTQGQFGENFA